MDVSLAHRNAELDTAGIRRSPGFTPADNLKSSGMFREQTVSFALFVRVQTTCREVMSQRSAEGI